MTAIVLDHEEPHEKAGGRHREQQAEPVAEIDRYPHQGPEQNQWPGRDDELDDAAGRARRAIAGEDLSPAAGVGRSRDHGRYYCVVQGDLSVVMADRRNKRDAPLVVTKERSANSVRIDGYYKAVSRLAQA